jgi:hypothetical protein
MAFLGKPLMNPAVKLTRMKTAAYTASETYGKKSLVANNY